MDTIDRAQEWRRLRELYRGMADEQLARIAAEAYDLTDLAKQALDAEIKTRGLVLKLATPPPKVEVEQEEQGPTPEELDPLQLDLVAFHHAEDLEEARKVKRILDAIGCYAWVGDENATSVDEYKGGFENGVDIKVERDAAEIASWEFFRYKKQHPEEQDHSEEDSDDDFTPATCPKCHSEDIVFRSRDPKLRGDDAFDAKYRWHCEACGHKWEDDGIIS